MHVQGRVCTVAAAPGILQKLGRVLKEKATGDLDRVFKGTKKTREKLGVRRGMMWQRQALRQFGCIQPSKP